MSDKNFKVKNGIDSTGPVTITTPNTSTTGLVINVPVGGKAVEFLRNGSYVGAIDDWGGLNTTQGINAAGFWYTRSPGIEAQSFFWAGSSIRSAAGFGGTSTGTNPVIYISSHSTGTNDLTQWLKPDNTIVAKVDYLGNITANDLTLAGNLTVNGTTTNLNSTNLIIEDKNIIIADVATPSDTTADGAGITVKGATDKTFNWVQSTKSFTTSDPLIINNTSTTTVPLIAKGYASQTANHFEVQDSAGNKMFVVNPPAGTLQPLEYFFVRPGGTGGTATIGTNSYSFRVVAANGNSVSFGTQGGGTSFQVVTSDTFNRYKIIGSGTGIAPTFTTDGNDANVNMYVTAKGAGKIGINTTSPTGYVHAVSSSSSTVGLIVEGATGQTSTNIFEVQRAGGGDPSFTVSHNYIDLNRNTTAAASMTVYGANSGQTPLHIKGRASQTADLVSIQQSSGFALARFDANANIVLGNTSVDSNNYLSFIKAGGAVGGNAGIRFGNDADGTNQHTLTVNTSNADLTLEHKNVNSRFIVKGAASQTANLTEWQNSAGTVLTSISPTGKLTSAVDASINGMTIGLGGGNVPTNIALGNSALLSNTTGFGNSAIGLSALQSNTTGWGNVGIGTRALQNFSGSVNTAIGYESLRYATAEGLVAIGYGSLSLNTSGVQNTAVGYSALGANVTGGANTALGSQSSRISTGHRNTSVGFYSAYSLTTGTDNTFLGSQAGQSFTTGSSNIAIGSYNSWYDVSTGSGNTFVGVDGGGQPVTGSNNTTLGYQTTISSSSVSNEITLGNSSVTRFRIPGIGLNITSNSTINTASASTVGLIIKGAASQTADLQQWQDSAGNVLATLKSSGTLVIGGTVSVNSTFGITLYNKALTSFYTGNNTSYEGTFNFTKGNTTGQWMAIGSTGNGANGVASINIADGGNFKLFSVGYTGNTEINLSSASSVGLIVKAAASQTADLQQWQDSAGTVLAKIMSNGSLFVNSTGTANDPITIQRASATRFKVDPYGNVFAVALTAGNVVNSIAGTTAGIYATSASTIGAVIRGAASQTANLQEWQDSAGIVLAKIDASGNITDASNTKWLSPIGSGSDDAPTIQALIDAGKKEIRLGSGQWTFSTRIKVPNGVTIRGTGTSRSSTTGTRVNAVALIASEGTVRDIMFTGAGENAQSELGGGGIAVLGGRVIDCSITDSRWVLAPTRQPHGYLKNFMSKMQGSYGSVKVAVLGDSLSENTSTTSWYGYLFNSATSATGYYLGSYFGHQIAPSEVDNMAIGGQGAYLLSAQLAMTKETLRTGDYVNQVLDGDRVSTSPFFNRDYNLAILAIGQNGGEDWKAHLEYTVKTIRDKGIDVIILTQNPAASNPTSRAGDEYFYRSMAETYGCLLVDTQAYFRLEVEFGRALGTTADLFGDSIHQSALGHQLYAKAILNALLDYDSTAAVPANKTVVSRSYIPAQADRAAAIAGLNSYYLVKRPDSLRGISGVTYTTATDTSIRNPIYGRGTTTNSVATIASGGYATWGVEYATAAYVIYRENATANTLTVALQAGGSTLATLTTGVTNGRTSVQKVMLSGGYPANRAIRITNTSGDPVQIYGVMFETHADVAFNRNTDGSYAGVKLNGSWTYSDFLSMASYGGYLTPHTSTTNDSVTFKFYGDGLRFATSYGKNSGIIQVKIDDTTYTAVDTYNNIGEYGVYTHFYGGLEYGLHTATITLTGANASVTGDLGHGARFGLHRISAVRSEWYLTQDQQFAPNSDTSSIVNSVSSIRMGSVGGANIATFYNGTNGYGAGSITSAGTFNINGANMGFPYTSTGATLNVNAGAASIVPLTVRGVASQTANLQEWQNSSGTVLGRVDNFGALYLSETVQIGPGTADQRIAGGGLTIIHRGGTSSVTFGIKAIASQTGDLTQWRNSSDTIIAKVDANGNFFAISKSFDILHPTKENMRLRHGSLEGPENGVYIRGTAESNIIELPEYWTGLVHKDSITVSLTAVGSAQNIYVEKIEDNKVYIGGELIKAFFTVYGERKDIDKLTVEY